MLSSGFISAKSFTFMIPTMFDLQREVNENKRDLVSIELLMFKFNRISIYIDNITSEIKQLNLEAFKKYLTK